MLERNSWPRTWTMRIFVGIALALACWLVPQQASAHTTISPADGPKISRITLGFTNGDYRDGNWVPIQVSLSNTGSDFSGLVSIDAPAPFMGTSTLNATQSTYQVPVSLPAGAQKQVTLYVPFNLGTQGSTQTVVVNLLDANGQKIATSSGALNSVGANDILVGVLSDQPAGNFSLLNGVSIFNSAVRINEEPLDATTLPPVSEVLKNFDVIVIDNFTTSKLSRDQIAALRDWVNQGGTLIAVGGPEWRRSLSALPSDLLPVTITGTDSLAPNTHLLPVGGPSRGGPETQTSSDVVNASVAVSAATAKPGSSITEAAGNIPLIVQGDRGQGEVFYLAFDPTLDPLVNWANTTNLWKGMIFRALGDRALGNNQAFGLPTAKLGIYSSTGVEGLIQTLFPNSYPAIWIILALLLGYILVLGPLRLLLVRRLKSRDWSWRIVLSTILVFSLLSYGLALQQKGTSILSGSISVIQLDQPDASGSTEHVTSYVGIYVPSQGDFQVHIPGVSLVQPSTQDSLYVRTPGQPAPQTQHTTIISRPDSSDVNLQGVDIWTLRTIVSQHNQRTQGGLTSHLALQNGTIAGTVTNALPYTINDAYMLVGDDFVSLGNLAPGKTQQVSLQLNSSLSASPYNNSQTSLADQIANSRGLNPPVNPYIDTNNQASSDVRRHMAMLAALSGEFYAYPCGGGPCYQSVPFGVANSTLTTRSTFAWAAGGIGQQTSRDPLLLPGAPVTLIGWASGRSADSADRVTINGNAILGTQEDFVRAPLPVDFSGPVTIPSDMVNSQLVDAEGQSNNSIQQAFPGTYSLTTGSLTFEFMLPTTARVSNSSLTFTESVNQTRGVNPYGNGPINDINHIHAYLYNWQTGKWDAVSFNQFTLQVQDSQPYIGPGGRILLQFANQDSTQGTTILSRPALQLQGTVSS